MIESASDFFLSSTSSASFTRWKLWPSKDENTLREAIISRPVAEPGIFLSLGETNINDSFGRALSSLKIAPTLYAEYIFCGSKAVLKNIW